MRFVLLMYFLWCYSQKRRSCIKGIWIEYMVLPWWLMLDSDSKSISFITAANIVHNETGTAMIFISAKEPLWRRRYSIFHEWYESRSYLIRERCQRRVLRSLFRNAEQLEKSHDEICELFASSLRTSEVHHLAALSAELRLAKREMNPDHFSAFLEEAYECRF